MKSALIIPEIKKIVASYTQKLTVRQIYYRLVGLGKIKNKQTEYKYLSRILVDARKSGAIPYDAIEDRTRSITHDINVWWDDWRKEVNRKIDDVKDAPYISFSNNFLQNKITLIILEKQALEGIFLNKLRNKGILVTCRGYNSLTQIKQLADILSGEEREVNCYFFSDFDPSGLDIQRNFLEQSKDLGLNFTSFRRVALTLKQIQYYNLIHSPTKLSDSRAKNWGHNFVVELDALDPNVLENLIEQCINENWDQKLYNQIDKLYSVRNRRAKKLYAKKLLLLAEKLMEK